MIVQKHQFSTWSLFLIGILLIIINFSWPPHIALSYDIYGYYLYLPMFFIHGNLDFSNMDLVYKLNELYKNTPTFYQLSYIDFQNYIIRYPIGLSILYLPFFVIGHGCALLFNFPADGFSYPYEKSIWIGSICISFIGYLFLYKTLIRYVSIKATNLALILLFLGTNLMVYNGMFGSNLMSHNYLFTLYALILYFSDKAQSQKSARSFYLGIFLCSIAALVRPVEIISLCIPLFWGGGKQFFTFLQNRKKLILSIMIIAAAGSLQMLYWKKYCGHFIVDSYHNAGEGLDLFAPHTFNYLFSFRKGWLIYTPLVAITLIGFILIRKRYPSIFYPLFITLILHIYFASSWSNWWYSSSFSSRAAVPSYALLAFPLAALLAYIFHSKAHRLIRIGLALSIGLCTVLNIFQTWQFTKGIIDPIRMTKAAYFKNFLKTERHPETDYLLLINRSEKDTFNFAMIPFLSHKVVAYEDLEYGEVKPNHSSLSYEGLRSEIVAPGQFSSSLYSTFNACTPHDHSFLKFSAVLYYKSDTVKTIETLICIEMQHNGANYFWRALNLKDQALINNGWNNISFNYLTPEVRDQTDLIKATIWNTGKDTIYLDKLMLESFY